VLQREFKRQSSQHRIVLSKREFEVFHDAFARLMEYMRQEHTPYQSPP
jgi:hypothetical protein